MKTTTNLRSSFQAAAQTALNGRYVPSSQWDWVVLDALLADLICPFPTPYTGSVGHEIAAWESARATK